MDDDRARLARRLRQQAEACTPTWGRGSPLYAALLTGAADDVEAGGPAYVVLRPHANDPPGSALPLRLTAALHRLVLERRAPSWRCTSRPSAAPPGRTARGRRPAGC